MKAKAGSAPASTYTTPSGKTVAIKKDDPQVAYLRGRLDQAKWQSRQSRVTTFYGSYYSRPVVVYSDPYPYYFWWWLLDRSLEERALWAYHHRPNMGYGSMDEARYRDLLSKDAQLEARIRALESQGVRRDPNYTPSAIKDGDLMYSDNFVTAVYNPQVPPQPPMRQANYGGGPSGATVLFWILGTIAAVLIIWFLIWLLTQKRW